MKYSLVAELIRENMSRETIRALAAYGYTDEPAERILDMVACTGSRQDCIDYLENLADDCYLYDQPDVIKNYFDYDAWARDLLLGGDYSILEHEGHCVLIDEHA